MCCISFCGGVLIYQIKKQQGDKDTQGHFSSFFSFALVGTQGLLFENPQKKEFFFPPWGYNRHTKNRPEKKFCGIELNMAISGP